MSSVFFAQPALLGILVSDMQTALAGRWDDLHGCPVGPRVSSPSEFLAASIIKDEPQGGKHLAFPSFSWFSSDLKKCWKVAGKFLDFLCSEAVCPEAAGEEHT